MTVLGKVWRTPLRQLPARTLRYVVREWMAFKRVAFERGTQWARVTMDRDIEAYILRLSPPHLNAVEISPNNPDWHARHSWRDYRELPFPKFDICKAETLPHEQFDVVICEQVLEHVVDPMTALRNLAGLCKPGGHVVISTPFLIRIHDEPGDYWRWTPAGMTVLIESCGLRVEAVRSWGNRRCVRANLYEWWAGYRPWHSLRNDEKVPVVVWSFASRAK